MASTDAETVHLAIEDELKIKVSKPNDKTYLTLIDGSAEIFGTPLLVNECYQFLYFSSVTVYTKDGCTLEIKSEASKRSNYKMCFSKKIPKLIDLHTYLEEFRARVRNYRECPVTVITGPEDAGKSTLCRLLVNYAVREGRKPIFIDLDIGQGSLSVTGTFGILSVDEPSDVYGRFKERATSVYYYGYKSPSFNLTLYKLLIEKIGTMMKRRLTRESSAKSSGVIVNTCGWVDGPGYHLLKDVINKLNVNVVIVLQKTSLYNKLKTDLPYDTNVKLVNNHTGAVKRNRDVRKNFRNSSVHEYFYGSLRRQIQPHHLKVNFKDLCVYRENYSPKCGANEQNVVPVPVDPNILNHILGLSYAEDVKDIPLSSLFGFICIVDVDMDSEIATVLSPKPGPLPTKHLLIGSIKLEPS